MAFQNYSLKGYNENCNWQLELILQVLPDLVQGLKSVESLSSHLKIADFGCSEGKNSVIMFKQLLESFRIESQTPVHVFHTDLPENNWSVFNQIIANPEFSYLSLPNTYFSTIGRSFYNQLFASNSIHLACSFFSFHYLSTKPLRELGDSTFPHQAFIKQSHSDIRNLIRLRLEELVTGGLLFFTVVGTGDTPNMNMGNILMTSLMKLLQQGVFSQEDMRNLEWNTFSLSLNDYGNIAKEFQDIAQVEGLSEFKGVSPDYVEYMENKDIDKYVEKLTGFYFTIMELQVYSILPETTSKSEAAQKLKEAISDVIRQNPEKEMYLNTIKLSMRKL